MIEWLMAHATSIQVIFGMLGGAWAFFNKLDSSYKRHLQDTLKSEVASKQDLAHLAHQVARISDKLDDVLLDGYRQSTGVRSGRRKKRARASV